MLTRRELQAGVIKLVHGEEGNTLSEHPAARSEVVLTRSPWGSMRGDPCDGVAFPSVGMFGQKQGTENNVQLELVQPQVVN